MAHGAAAKECLGEFQVKYIPHYTATYKNIEHKDM
jgi:hypothetical protein